MSEEMTVEEGNRMVEGFFKELLMTDNVRLLDGDEGKAFEVRAVLEIGLDDQPPLYIALLKDKVIN